MWMLCENIKHFYVEKENYVQKEKKKKKKRKKHEQGQHWPNLVLCLHKLVSSAPNGVY